MVASEWFQEKKLTWFQRLCVNILKQGPIPKHVAFIMDGNRRYAERHDMEKIGGHVAGFERLADTLQWCRDIGINEVTVYAFSIENFKRSTDEVEALMSLARNKFEQLLKEKDKVNELGVCIRVLGNISLLPDDIQQLIASVVLMSSKNNKAFLNVAFSYTSREEMSRATARIADGVDRGELLPEDITETLLESSLDTRHSPNPDLLVRTSGEVRLSDFLLWQSGYSCIYYTRVLWPDFSFWHLLAGIVFYQTQYAGLKRARCKQEEMSIRSHNFINNLNTREQQWLDAKTS